tara:strand:+ start:5983 stop:7005 length:1023 start_codon:yes stop_codon:yes gene_type:complete
MEKDKKEYKILVVEDNPGDYLLVEDYLEDHILSPQLVNAKSFHETKEVLAEKNNKFDIILLDLTLPDMSGEGLINKIKAIVDGIPIIVLTGYSDVSFAVRSLSLGVADYLLKDSINSIALYKSVVYNIERFKFIKSIQDSEKKYSDLFQLSPLPIWVYDLETLKFLDINKAAIHQYGYSREEFLSMTIEDIRPKEDMPKLKEAIELSKGKDTFYFEGLFRHIKKNGDLIYVDVRSNIVTRDGKKAEIVLANDVTERVKHMETIEKQNEKLKEIAWLQSHVVRAPLSRMMALIKEIENESLSSDEKKLYLSYVLESANELDHIVKDVVSKSQQIITLESKS